VENLVSNKLFKGLYHNRKIFVTGHTGFKGAWLVQWLQMMGAQVTGYAYASESNTIHYQKLQPRIRHITGDILDPASLTQAIEATKPDLIFHLAAQSLVRKSYVEPLQTYQTNLIGTLNLYEACRYCESIKGIVSITSDKVYENKETGEAYDEEDVLGGFDMYSSSKACVEIMTSSYRNSFLKNSENFQKVLVTARAGNVIGGGDYADDRIVPDMMKALASDQAVYIRSPKAVRPWQHVLEPLSGYLLLGQYILESKELAEYSWNFGPEPGRIVTVGELVDMMKKEIPQLRYELKSDNKFHEAGLLSVDSTRAHKFLNWYPVWDASKAISTTAKWYKSFILNKQVVTGDDIVNYVHEATAKNIAWTLS
jgi:CDP-glucose 4,6-dehydratase